jgi:myo-inositol-1(or 4)-monophosphatase
MIDSVITAAKKAGRIIQDIRSRPFDVEQKGEMGPVTEADLAADKLLKKELLALEPCGWLSEETADDHSRLDLDRLWVVDPLDGTKEFVKGIPEYTVAIALVDSGVPILGVVFNPVTGETYWAEQGKGAFKDSEPITVAEGDGLLASRSEVKRGEFEPFDDRWDVRIVGSIEYKLALIAAGNGAVTFSRGPKHEWDVCAGAVIVEEAGGKATDLFGEALRFNQPFPKTKGILAGAPEAYARALEEIREIGASDRMAEMDGR